MKKTSCVILVSAFILAFSTTSQAAPHDITVFVDGRSGPWNVNINPSFSYNQDMLRPMAVGSTFYGFGSNFSAGNMLEINYVSGLASPGLGIWADANGVNWHFPLPNPGDYIPGPNNLEQVVGTFADSYGVIVGTPFTIGNHATVVIPAGATQLLMGFNDNGNYDNAGGVYMNVALIPEPETYAMLLVGLGLVGFMARRRKETAV